MSDARVQGLLKKHNLEGVNKPKRTPGMTQKVTLSWQSKAIKPS